MPYARVERLIVGLGALIAIGCGDSHSVVAPSAPVRVSPPAPPSLVDNASLPMYAPTSSDVPTAPSVRVVNQSGAGVPGVAVRFTVTSGGGSVGDTLVLSDGAGFAACGRWTLGEVEGTNTLIVSTAGSQPITFVVIGLRPILSGVSYVLRMRDGSSLRPGDEGTLTLGTDSTFRLVYSFGVGSAHPVVAINVGRYVRTGSKLAFKDYFFGDEWASGDLDGDTLTFQYDDYLDIGFHSIVVEVYNRTP